MSNWLKKLSMIGGVAVAIAGQAQALPLPPKAQPWVGAIAGIGAVLAGLYHPAPAAATDQPQP